MDFKWLIIWGLFVGFNAQAVETCSRIATINFQEVLVDASSTRPGEGLRYYLEKDQKALSLLNQYQEESRPTVRGALFSTAGSLMILTGILGPGDAEKAGNRNTLILGGLSIILGNYFISSALQSQREKILEDAVQEYNKRNSPKIYFSPFSGNDKSSIGLGVGISQEF